MKEPYTYFYAKGKAESIHGPFCQVPQHDLASFIGVPHVLPRRKSDDKKKFRENYFREKYELYSGLNLNCHHAEMIS